MSLVEYRNKRDFARTSEPEGAEEAPESGPLRFVVQKHQASHLHYDFRLEVSGVLKSWAVPKGPSLDPVDRKLAMMVEDHPWDYRNFEGSIERGNYGAGTVMIWDEGTYEVPEAADREDAEKKMRAGLHKGHLQFVLHGQKLKGGYDLVRMRDDEKGNSWLLIKRKDEFASDENVLAQDRSARTGESMEEIKENGRVWQSNREQHREKPLPEAEPVADLSRFDLSGAKPGPMPKGVEPMLATLAAEPFDREEWFYELKWDGFRAIAEVRREQADLCSRHNKSYEKEFRPIVEDLKKLGYEVLLDGEVVVVDEQGRADFKLLQNYRKTGKGLLVYYVFDLLWMEGRDLRALPLYRRKELLKQMLPDLPRIKYSDHIEREGIALYKLAIEHDLEGIIAKDKNSHYRGGVRSREWLKFKTHQRQEAVIAGWTEPRGARNDLGALLLGVYEGKELIYVGHTGGGFTKSELTEMKKRLEPLKRKESPFKPVPKTNAPATWVEPALICEVRFADWTADGNMRQPIFLGLREDKDPRQVRHEKAIPTSQALERKKFIPKESSKKTTLKLNGHEVTVSNPRKVFWPEEGITKEDMINYYRAMSAVLLPYLQDRPLSLHRFPNGIQGKSFFQKDVDEAPEW